MRIAGSVQMFGQGNMVFVEVRYQGIALLVRKPCLESDDRPVIDGGRDDFVSQPVNCGHRGDRQPSGMLVNMVHAQFPNQTQTFEQAKHAG